MNVLLNVFGETQTFFLEEAMSVIEIKRMIKERLSIPIQDQALCGLSGQWLYDDDEIELDGDFQTMTLCGRLLGGKGGFGSMLRAKGARMSSRKATNFESCRDLSGRRLQTLHDAEKLADYVEKESERKRKQTEEKEKKIQEGLAASIIKKPKFDDQEFVKEHEKTVESMKDTVAKVQRHVPLNKKKTVFSAW
jgi:hypothetical protein